MLSFNFRNSYRAREIYDAIQGKSTALLQSILNDTDPSVQSGIYFDYANANQTPGENDTEYNNRIKVYTFHSNTPGTFAFVSFLHIAVHSCDLKYSGNNSSLVDATALEILNILISFCLKHAGTPWTSEYRIDSNTTVYNTYSHKYRNVNINHTAQHFAAILKSTNDSKTLKMCIENLVKYQNSLKKAITLENDTPMQSVPSSVFKSWEKLLFNEKFSDIIFEVVDDSVEPSTVKQLYAHRNILACSSDYFDSMLTGLWKEASNETHSIIKVNQKFEVYKNLLRFIYTGQVEKQILTDHAMDLLDLAAQGQYDGLTSLCELEAIKLMRLKNVIGMLLASYRFDLRRLKDASHNFIKKNSSLLMFDTEFMSLSQSHKEIWDDIKKASGQNNDVDNNNNNNDDGAEAKEDDNHIFNDDNNNDDNHNDNDNFDDDDDNFDDDDDDDDDDDNNNDNNDEDIQTSNKRQRGN